ncbi:bifunctional folylpolyglutamate synthase/dihydrofolate synthase [Dermabacteraceae bacterium TAE3-ERU27]|nr:bifunctional folylpolyglutamate synthase/dihydrofolate synthase [Dermabacteraceae bacterium TAE3-ERU27]
MDETLREVYAALLARAPENKIEPDISRVQRALNLMGDPHLDYQTIHLAGTNGKTSTARMSERILREAGLRTGRFTSPHLHTPTERIAIDGEPISAADFAQAYADVLPFVEMVDAENAVPMTFFEVVTLMAFQAFASAPVDVAVIETGMGGTWDATNVVAPAVTVITPIGYDHQAYLGNDIADIAVEKAGILKTDAFAVIAEQPYAEAADVLREKLTSVGASAALVGEQIGVISRTPGVGGQLLTLQTMAGRYENVFLSLLGSHQAENALLAVAACEAFLTGGQAPLDGDLLTAALAAVTSPGRAEVVRQAPTIVVDAAHNPAGAEALVEAVRENFRFTHTVGIVGVLADKDSAEILAILEPLLDEVVVTRSSSPRAIPADELADLARDIFEDPDRVHEAPRLDDAIQLAVDLAERRDDLFGGVVACGSVTVAAEVRALLKAPEDRA